MVIQQRPDVFSFSSTVKEIVISSSGSVVFVLSWYDVTIGDVVEIFRERYTPDARQTIVIGDLDAILKQYTYLPPKRERFVYTLSAEDGTGGGGVFDLYVLHCRTAIRAEINDFLSTRFLTLHAGAKVVYPDQKELLSLYVTDATPVVAKVKRMDGTLSEVTLTTVVDTERATTVDASPSLLGDTSTIAHYVIEAGARRTTYYLRRDALVAPVQLVFQNSFGVRETFIPSGLIVRENKYDALFGKFGGNYRKYKAELVREYTAHTGILNDATARWIEDMFDSPYVAILASDGSEEEATITETTVKRTTAREELPSYEFKYRPAKAGQATFVPSARSGVFDDSFDATFS